MAETRTPRDNASREKEAREVYVPPSTLPNPTPEPGKTYRWVATHVMGALDHTNASSRFRDGWVPVKASDHPELMLAPNANGNVEVGGLMLCSMPTERAKARAAYFAKQAEEQMASVDNTLLRQSDARMPMVVERNSQETRGSRFGTGS